VPWAASRDPRGPSGPAGLGAVIEVRQFASGRARFERFVATHTWEGELHLSAHQASYRDRMGMIWVGYRRDAGTARHLLEDPDRLEELLESDDDVTSVDLDKAWHGLHWLLTGSDGPSTGPLSDAIFGGEAIGEDLGYGPGRLVSPEHVRSIAVGLREIGVDTLRTRMNAPAMIAAEIYPVIWDEDDVFDTYLVPAFENLRDFYSAAADREQAVIQTIC
jgi:hypothetical protein